MSRVLVLLIFSMFIGSSMAIANPKAVAPAAMAAIEMSLQEAADLEKKGEVLILDVREDHEVRKGMAQPAHWMPMSKINAHDPAWEALVEKNKDKTFAVYCAVGGRAGTVVELLLAKKIKAANLGGFYEWKKAQLPIKSGPGKD